MSAQAEVQPPSSTPLPEPIRCYGRDRELARIERLLDGAVAAHNGQLAYVCGPRGIGKGRLLDELGRRLAARGVAVLEVGGAGATSLLGALARAPGAGLDAAGALDLLTRDREATDLFALLLADQPDRGGTAVAPVGDESARFALHARVARLLVEASRRRPVALLVRDLDGADDATRELVAHLARTRLASSDVDFAPDAALCGLVVVASCEPDPRWLDGVAVERIDLAGLGADGVSAFLGSPEVVSAVARATGGHPRALEALVAAATATAPAAAPACALDGLSSAARSAAQALALHGAALDASELSAIAGADASATPRLLDELLAARLVDVRGAPGSQAQPGDAAARSGGEEPSARRGAFDDDELGARSGARSSDDGLGAPVSGGSGTRSSATLEVKLRRADEAEALAATLDEADRRDLHARIGRQLATRARPGSVADVIRAAEHLVAARAGESAVDAALVAATALDARGSSARAARLLHAAHALTTRDDVRAQLERRLLDLLERSGDVAGALGHAERLRRRAPDDAALARRVGRLHLLADDVVRARAAFDRARSLAVAAADRHELARVLAASAELHALAGRHGDAVADGEDALGLARALAAPDGARLRIDVRNTLGKVHLAESRYADALRLFVANADEARAGASPVDETRALGNQGIVHLRLCDHAGATRAYQAALAVADRSDDHRHRAFCLQNLGVLAHVRAEYGTALRYFREAGVAFKAIGQRGRLAWLGLDLASVYLDVGALDEARAVAQLAAGLSAGAGGPAAVAINTDTIAGRIALAAGDVAAARERFESARRRADAASSVERYAEATVCLARLELDEGDGAAATALLAALPATPSPAVRARALLVGGELLLDAAGSRAAARRRSLVEAPRAGRPADASPTRAAASIGAEGSPPDGGAGSSTEARRQLEAAADLAHQVGDAELEWRAQFALGRLAARSADAAEANRRYRLARGLDAVVRAGVPEELRPRFDADPVRRALACVRADSLAPARRFVEAARRSVAPLAPVAAAVGGRRLEAADLTPPPTAASTAPVTAAVAAEPPRSRATTRATAAGGRGGSVTGVALIGRDPRVVALDALVDRVAPTDSVVLLRGEAGSGKERVAEALHARSRRADRPLERVRCGALVEPLLLDELFGGERSARSCGRPRRRGAFERAQGGTLLLDEIGDLSPHAQVALVGALQDGVVDRGGGHARIDVDVRLICTTSRHLEARVADGTFRADLYYCLRAHTIDVPALRERTGDLPLVAEWVLGRIAAERGGHATALSAEALALLAQHDWPGNLRELENVLRSVSLLSAGAVITASDLAASVATFRGVEAAVAEAAHALPAQEGPKAATVVRGATEAPIASAPAAVASTAWDELQRSGLGLRELQRRIEIECITRALVEARGNITRAATLLKMKRPRLSQLIKEYGLAQASAGEP